MTDHAKAVEAAKRIANEPDDAAASLRYALKPDHIIVAKALLEREAQLTKAIEAIEEKMGRLSHIPPVYVGMGEALYILRETFKVGEFR